MRTVSINQLGFLRSLKDDRFLWQVCFIAFFLLSLGLGLGGNIVFTIGWGIMAILTLLFAFRGFPNMFSSALYLVLAYLTVFGAVIAFLWVPEHRSINLAVILGFFLEGAGVAFLIVLVGRIWKTRDHMAERGKYVPLGFWTIMVFVFFLSANASLFFWGLWASGQLNNLAGYIIAEAFMAFVIFYVLRVPEMRFGKDIEPLKIPGVTPMTDRFFTKDRKEPLSFKEGTKTCPVCNGSLRTEERICPSCKQEQTFYWCPRSEAFFVECTRCGRLTSYEKKECIFCSQPVKKKVKCKVCDNDFLISEWKLSKQSVKKLDDWD